jgi:Flp pilus assembly protein CpaB
MSGLRLIILIVGLICFSFTDNLAQTAGRPKSTQPGTPTPPTAPTSAVNYTANWLFYLQRMSPAQLQRWCAVIKSRVSITVLAEAVDVVMRESPQLEK